MSGWRERCVDEKNGYTDGQMDELVEEWIAGYVHICV